MSASPESSGSQPATSSDTSSIPPSSPPSEASTPASTITPPTPISQAASASPASTTKAMAAQVATALPSSPATSASSSSPANAPAGPSGALPMRKRTLADYRLGRTLGEGSYSTVVAAVEIATKRDYAIKILDKRHIIRENKVKYVNIEKNTLYKLDHPGVVKLYSTFQDMSSLCKQQLSILCFQFDRTNEGEGVKKKREAKEGACKLRKAKKGKEKWRASGKAIAVARSVWYIALTRYKDFTFLGNGLSKTIPNATKNMRAREVQDAATADQ